MKWIHSNYFFAAVAIAWLCVREYPYGDMMQTVTDMALLAAAVITLCNVAAEKK